MKALLGGASVSGLGKCLASLHDGEDDVGAVADVGEGDRGDHDLLSGYIVSVWWITYMWEGARGALPP